MFTQNATKHKIYILLNNLMLINIQEIILYQDALSSIELK